MLSRFTFLLGAARRFVFSGGEGAVFPKYETKFS